MKRELWGCLAAAAVAASLVFACAVHGGPLPAEPAEAGDEPEPEEPLPDAGLSPFEPFDGAGYSVTDAGCPAAMPYRFSACTVDASNPFVSMECRYVHRGGCSVCFCQPNLQGDFWNCHRCAP